MQFQFQFYWWGYQKEKTASSLIIVQELCQRIKAKCDIMQVVYGSFVELLGGEGYLLIPIIDSSLRGMLSTLLCCVEEG
jgi:hypothetical protein